MQNIRRYSSLDLLKFIMAIIIIFHHYHMSFWGEYCLLMPFYGGRIYWGYLCEMFFIISGFISAGKNVIDIDFKSYIGHRMLRLLPLTQISVVGCTFSLIGYKLLTGETFCGIVPSIWRFVNSLLLTYAGGIVSDVPLAINHPLWYVGILLICYSWFWCICKFSAKHGNEYYLLLCLSMSMIGLVGLQYEWNCPYFNGYSCRGYASFFLGVILFEVYNRLKSKGMNIICLVTIALLVILGVINFDLFYDNQWGIFVYILFPCILFTCLNIEKLFSKFGKLCKFLGDISFHMYIWHMMFIILLGALSKKSNFVNIYSNYTMIMFTVFMIVVSALMQSNEKFYIQLVVKCIGKSKRTSDI